MKLDGSEDSFKRTVDTLKLYADIPGLRINFDKTKAVWFGPLRYCRRNIQASTELYGIQELKKILRIKLLEDLESMVHLNFGTQNVEIKKPLNFCCKCKLTPLGKIAVIKSSAVSKMIHLLLCLPDPPNEFLKNLNYHHQSHRADLQPMHSM